MLTRFKQSYIQPNRDMFQFILFRNTALSSDKSRKIGDTILKPLESVKRLGIFVDRRLNINVYISEPCRKATKQLSALDGLANNISTDDKYVLFGCFILSHFIFYCPVYSTVAIYQTRRKLSTSKRGFTLCF